MGHKKILRYLLTCALCLTMLSGCGNEKPQAEAQNSGTEEVREETDGGGEDPGKAIRDSVLEQLGNKKNDVTYDFDGTTLTINGHEMDINSHISTKTDRIMDCQRVGDWIIANCHINPQVGLYAFYNTGDLTEPAYEITGNDLTWRDDDISTAVSFRHNEIYDFWGNMIGFVQDGEVYELNWIDDTTVGAECWIVDEIGRELEFTEKFEYKHDDSAVLSYYEYMIGGDRKLNAFLDKAPEDAVALVIVNPPEKILNRLPDAQVYDEGAYDRVVVVSLLDDVTLHVDSGNVSASGREENHMRFHELDKGEACVFQMTVPEGMPNGRIEVRTKDRGTAYHDVWILSGESPVMSRFLFPGEPESAGMYTDEPSNTGGNTNESANSGGYSDVELCTMAAAYYKNENGYEPPYVDVDSTNGNMVTLHLYEVTDGHTATYAWYDIDRMTGQGEDLILGGIVDLTPFK